MKMTLLARGLIAALGLCGLAANAEDAVKTDCPPVAQAPSPEQIAELQKTAKDRGALWKISKDGRDSYLYGTVHVGQLDWVFPGPHLVQALQATEVLAVEVDITAPGTQAEMQTAQQAAAKLALSAKDQARLDKQADLACVPRGAFAPLHPIMQAITYVALSGRRAGLDPSYGQEPMLLGFARAKQRPVVSLESIGLQMSVLLPGDAKQARKFFDSVLDTLEKGKSVREMQYLGKAWETGNLAALEGLEKVCQCKPTADERAFHRRLNDERNPHLAARIVEEHDKGKPVLVAVGALHMTGPNALPKLLAAKGFQVERINP